ncbi:MAG: hypothetical protein A3K19_29785 [Lentisphaerae bacterium RIFOXYB12_FULL_65_16]|nr:MAG: hypothetical protein A3K18_33395 [Lentisphaerae bacterium RIFOXYA12_64_32]OGV86520.1 MAG: hypothetical protein A3K19_29785 [Lentisphaerae bacterium RIFOXYB12_FULL_65_16]
MSHFTTIEVQIKDVAALRAACAELGLELRENAVARGYGSSRVRGDYVIRLKGPYDVALTRQPHGFGLAADLWDGHVERELGPGLGRLKQLYGVHKATAEARRKGLTVRRQALANGGIRLALCRA